MVKGNIIPFISMLESGEELFEIERSNRSRSAASRYLCFREIIILFGHQHGNNLNVNIS